MGHKYTLAHGAKRNVGDFLIRDRAINLLKEYRDVEESDIYLVDLVRRNVSRDELDAISGTDAVIIAGGPGYQQDFYPGVYPSLDTILEQGVPVYPLGPGWKGFRESEYEFTTDSKEMLQRIYSQIEIGGVRDTPTKRCIESIGIDNVELTGCPAWYDLNRTQPSFTPPDSIDSFVVSSPAMGSYRYAPQWIYLLYKLSREFPNAIKYCSFHQGISYAEGYNDRVVARYNETVASIARNLGYEVLDMGGQPEKLAQYRDIDLHVGYRVHAHIPFIANGQPSFLIHQDGRGLGASEALTTVAGDVTGFGRTAIKSPVDDVLRNIGRNIRTGFADFNGVDDALSDARKNMERLLNSLP